MPLADLTSREAVESALNEFDEIGREAFLAKYGFGRARRYFVRRDGRYYDSKAIVGAAVGFEHPDRGPMHQQRGRGGSPGQVTNRVSCGPSQEPHSLSRSRRWSRVGTRDGLLSSFQNSTSEHSRLMLSGEGLPRTPLRIRGSDAKAARRRSDSVWSGPLHARSRVAQEHQHRSGGVPNRTSRRISGQGVFSGPVPSGRTCSPICTGGFTHGHPGAVRRGGNLAAVQPSAAGLNRKGAAALDRRDHGSCKKRRRTRCHNSPADTRSFYRGGRFGHSSLEYPRRGRIRASPQDRERRGYNDHDQQVGTHSSERRKRRSFPEHSSSSDASTLSSSHRGLGRGGLENPCKLTMTCSRGVHRGVHTAGHPSD
jgi:hypothetical protein